MSRKQSDRLVVVANRLPVHRVGPKDGGHWETSPGGLVSAVAPFVQQRTGAWVGWPGSADDTPEPFVHDDISIQPVALSEDELEGFYYGCSNATLWPLYHDAIRPPVFRRSWWRTYERVNRRFAEQTAATLKSGDQVWVHDYQLQLVPGMLREMRPDLRIGFFLHIPFPPEEIFARLPWRRQLVEGLLGADVLGFQTKLGAQNFSRIARRFTEARGSDARVEYGGRTIKVGAFPISIDIGRYEKLAAHPDVVARSADLREKVGRERVMILGVDRMDYTKGIDTRLRAFGEMLSRGEITSADCVFYQIAVPSREKVEEYERLRRHVEEIVGRINGEYSEPALSAVHYLRRNLPIEELVAFYLAADIMTVTPLRDGMNLVAKEYVATRLENTGVLVLSEFAGAAAELRSAVMVNPYDLDGMASALERAIRLPRQVASQRMKSLRRALKKNDVYDWANAFLMELNAEQSAVATHAAR